MDTPHYHKAPLGPSTAIDITGDGRILCFEEKTNRIVEIDISNGSNNGISYRIADEFNFERYYWSQIVHIHSTNVILALLKYHATKMFWLVSFRLIDDRRVALAMFKLKTKIRSDGYHVSSQRLDGCCYFGFSNERLGRKKNGNDGTAKKTESVILQATCCHETGHINAQIHCIGHDRFPLSLRKPSFELQKHKRQSSFTGLQTQYMSRQPTGNLCQPFFHRNRAIFIDKSDPSVAYIVNTFSEPEYGLRAAVSAHARKTIDRLVQLSTSTLSSDVIERPMTTKQSPDNSVETVTIDCNDGQPPNGTSTWSNAYVVGDCAYIYVDERGTDRRGLWKLIMSTDDNRLNKSIEQLQYAATGDDVVVQRSAIMSSKLADADEDESSRSSCDSNSSLGVVEYYVVGKDANTQSTTNSLPNQHLTVSNGISRTVSSRSAPLLHELESESCVDPIQPMFRWQNVSNVSQKMCLVPLIENMVLRIDANSRQVCIRGRRESNSPTVPVPPIRISNDDDDVVETVDFVCPLFDIASPGPECEHCFFVFPLQPGDNSNDESRILLEKTTENTPIIEKIPMIEVVH